MENENRLMEPETPKENPVVEEKSRWMGLRSSNVGKYIRYVVFIVVIGLVYIWNSHVAENQVREENKLRKQIYDAKAEYKTIHARLSAGTRRQVISEKVDSLGLRTSSNNVFKLKNER
jgi:cell division protein FtsL